MAANRPFVAQITTTKHAIMRTRLDTYLGVEGNKKRPADSIKEERLEALQYTIKHREIYTPILHHHRNKY